MQLKEALEIRPGDVVSLVGGGGKTTLMFALARELSVVGPVITTTTTKIMEPSTVETDLTLVDGDEAKLLKMLLANLGQYRRITLARRRFASGKLNGISRELITKLAGLKQVAYIIIEADGASRRPLKAPNDTEPVIPDNTTLVVAMVGIEAIGRPLTEDNVFRAEIASRLLGKPIGEAITSRDVVRLLTHPQGIAKGAPAGARLVPVINKVDLDRGLAKSRTLAREIMATGNPQIGRVVLARVQSPDPVEEVITR